MYIRQGNLVLEHPGQLKKIQKCRNIVLNRANLRLIWADPLIDLSNLERIEGGNVVIQGVEGAEIDLSGLTSTKRMCKYIVRNAGAVNLSRLTDVITLSFEDVSSVDLATLNNVIGVDLIRTGAIAWGGTGTRVKSLMLVNTKLTALTGFESLFGLSSLKIRGCGNLKSTVGVPVENLRELEIVGRTCLPPLDGFSALEKLEELTLGAGVQMTGRGGVYRTEAKGRDEWF